MQKKTQDFCSILAFQGGAIWIPVSTVCCHYIGWTSRKETKHSFEVSGNHNIKLCHTAPTTITLHSSTPFPTPCPSPRHPLRRPASRIEWSRRSQERINFFYFNYHFCFQNSNTINRSTYVLQGSLSKLCTFVFILHIKQSCPPNLSNDVDSGSAG